MASNRDYALLITSSNVNWGTGGIERYIKAQVEYYLLNGVSCYTIFPIRKSMGPISVEYLGVMEGFDFLGVCAPQKLVNYFEKDAKDGAGQIFIHSLINWNIRVLQRLIEAINPSGVSFYLHDYYSICIQYNLLKNGKYYCGDSKVNASKCSDCEYYQRTIEHRTVLTHFFNNLGKYENKFIAPSETAKKMFAEAYPQFIGKIIVIPHLMGDGEYIRRKRKDITTMKIAFVGAKTISKGWDSWLRVSDAILEKTSNYKIYYFGEYEDHRPGITNIHVSTKDGKDAMIKALRDNNIDVCLLLSIWPETYSYTFFESEAAGCYIVTAKTSGNIAHMVLERNNGIVLDNSMDSLSELLFDYDAFSEKVKKYFDKDVIVPLGYRDNIPDVTCVFTSKNDRLNTAFSEVLKKRSFFALITEKLYTRKYSDYLEGTK